MKTFGEVLDLESNWHADPIFDLEDTEGFEEYREELLRFRLNSEKEWNRLRDLRLDKLSADLGLPGNHHLARKWEAMERRIQELQDKFDRHDDNHPQPARRR